MKKIKISKKGYSFDSKDNKEEALVIPSNNITMKKVPYPIMAYPNVGQPTQMMPGRDYHFPNADYVTEVPMMQRGGIIGDLMPQPMYNMNGIYNPNRQDSVQYKHFFDSRYNQDPQYLKDEQMLNRYGSLVDPERMSQEEAIKRLREEQIKKNAFKDINPKLTAKQKKELYRPFDLPNKQAGGVPNARKVDVVPEGYIPYSIPNYYHNPQSSKASGNITGPKMSDAAWKEFVQKNPNWNKSTNTDDFVYIDPQTNQPAPSASAPKPEEAFRGEPIQGHFGLSRRLVGFIDRPMKKTADINQNEGMVDTSMEDAYFMYASPENSPNYGKPDPSKGKYKFDRAALNKLMGTTNYFQDGKVDLSEYRINDKPNVVTNNKMRAGGIIKAQNGLNNQGQSKRQYASMDMGFQSNPFQNFSANINGDTSIVDPNREKQYEYDPRQIPKWSGLASLQKDKKHFNVDPNLTGLLLNKIGDWTEPDFNDRQLNMQIGSSDAQFATYQGNRGDYDSNSGQFRPDSYVPTQFGNPFMSNYGMPKAQLGMSFGDNSERMSLGMSTPQPTEMFNAPQEGMQSPVESSEVPMGDMMGADSDFKNFIAQKESGGNYLALPKKKDGTLASSAVGKYQFLWKQHKDWISRVTGINAKDAFRHNPEAQEKAFDYWDNTVLTPEAIKLKQTLGLNVPINTIKSKIHFAGVKGAFDFYKHGKETKDGFGTTTSSYEMGGEYEMDEDEIKQFMKNGGQVEFL